MRVFGMHSLEHALVAFRRAAVAARVHSKFTRRRYRKWEAGTGGGTTKRLYITAVLSPSMTIVDGSLIMRWKLASTAFDDA